MPALVGGFGNKQKLKIYLLNNKFKYFQSEGSIINYSTKPTTEQTENKIAILSEQLGPYLAGLIEGDGTFAVHDKKSTAKKYAPMIIIVFKKSDLPLAEYLQNLSQCGSVYLKENRGYVLWQIQDIVSIFTILKIINGYMRTPKIEALNRTINWLNEYILNNQKSNLPSTRSILSQINFLDKKPIDNSPIDSNAWLSGLSDADGNFSINIHQRSNKNLTRVQLFYRLELRQNYHRLDPEGQKVSYFSIMSIISEFLGVNVLSRNRIIKDRQFYSFIVMAHNKNSKLKLIKYLEDFPLLSSKYLDYQDWLNIFNLQETSLFTSLYLEKAINTRINFNSTRINFTWDHLKNSYLSK